MSDPGKAALKKLIGWVKAGDRMKLQSDTIAVGRDSIRAIADAFAAVEKERDEAQADAAHYYALAVDDPGKNPPLFWKDVAAELKRERENPPEPALTCPHIDRLVASGELTNEAVRELHDIRDINSQLRYGTWVLNARAEASEKERDDWRWAATQQQEITKVAEAALTAEREKNDRLLELVRWAHDTLYEINPSNYDHDEVCKINDASVEVILGLAPTLGERHGKSAEWWANRTAYSGLERGEGE